jgi:hypothetical protein
MYEFQASRYHEAIICIQQAISLVRYKDGRFQTRQLSPGDKDSSLKLLDRLAEILQPLDVPVTKLTIRDAKLTLQHEDVDFLQCGNLMLVISQNLGRELESVKIFSLDDKKTEFYSPNEPLFGPEVDRNFQSVSYEIEQGGKCYACDLTTAAAFHWIRSLEAGIRAMARCLGIPDPTTGRERNWGQLNEAFRLRIEANWPKSSGRMTGDAHLFDKLYGSISGMQNPYRNETMHLSAKYTAPEALHIFELVKGLMTQIASRMDEDGNPKV